MPERAVPPEWAAKIWRVLVEECGARDGPDDAEHFACYLGQEIWCGHEWRFMGALGFGGKFYNDGCTWRVGCYPEHYTPKRKAMITRANTRLAALREEKDG